jgi:hypothetical protein
MPRHGWRGSQEEFEHYAQGNFVRSFSEGSLMVRTVLAMTCTKLNRLQS